MTKKQAYRLISKQMGELIAAEKNTAEVKDIRQAMAILMKCTGDSIYLEVKKQLSYQ